MHTREMHLEMAKCLKLAKRHLILNSYHIDKEFYVCSAVSRTNSPKAVRIAVLKWISKQLGGYAFVTTWAQMHYVNLSRVPDEQAYRHAWVDHMIKVLES